jgi:hypothetical protein
LVWGKFAFQIAKNIISILSLMLAHFQSRSTTGLQGLEILPQTIFIFLKSMTALLVFSGASTGETTNIFSGYIFVSLITCMHISGYSTAQMDLELHIFHHSPIFYRI